MSEEKESSGKGLLYLLLVGVLLFVSLAPISLLILVGGSQSVASAAECKPVSRTSASASAEVSESASFTLEAASTAAVNVPAEYVEPIKKAAEVSGLPESIVAKQIQAESNFNRLAGSSAGAKGLAIPCFFLIRIICGWVWCR